MSVNTAHANNGVLIHAGECILIFSDNVTMEFSGQDPLFKGTKNGRIYLTTHRMIYNAKNSADPLQSFSFPFITLSDVELEQPTFGANYIKGKVRAQPNGNWTGEAKFKLHFKSGGAIDFGQAMLRAARLAQRNGGFDAPPPYTPPNGGWYEAPPPAYAPSPQGYYGWVPNTQAFPNGPPPNSVFMTDNPPPYPGIIPPTGPPQQQPAYNPNGYPQSGYPGGPPPTGYPGGPPQTGYPGGPPPTGYPGGPPQTGYPGGPPPSGYPPSGYPSGATGYPGGPPGTGGYPSGGYPNYPNQPAPGGYPPQQPGAMGFSAPPQNSKEAEAAQSAYYDPNQPQTAYVPPPAYYEPPPSYNSLSNKKDQ